MKRTKKQNKEILAVVEIAKKYVEEGYKIGEAISLAQKEVRKEEKDKYEGRGC